MAHYSRNGILVSEEEAKRIDMATVKERPRETVNPSLTAEARDFIIRTEKKAEAIVKDAQVKAEAIVKEAQVKAEAIVKEAQVKAEASNVEGQ